MDKDSSMKKINLSLLAVSSLLTASLSFAAVSDSNKYFSTLHPQVKNASIDLLHPPTDISIVNASSNYIYVVVPPVNDRITPGFNDHIYGYDPTSWQTWITLQDPYRSTFFADYVCKLAIVTVYGAPGSYRINIDSDLCN